MKDLSKLIGLTDYSSAVNGKIVKTVNPPVYNGSTVLFEKYEDMILANSGQFKGATYGTSRLPTQRVFEEALRKLEGGHITRAFQSGLSAIVNTLLAFTKTGDHILVCENVYGPNARFCTSVLSKFNIEITFVHSAVGADIIDHIKDNTKLIFLESPGSNTFEIQDIPAVTKIAHSKDIITVIDNTWATPLFLKPFKLGIDVVIQSVTKYICGHSDVLLGTVSVNEKYSKQFSDFYHTLEIYASPDDCYLALRGLRTLQVRMKHHEKAALKIAQWLKTVDVVDDVIHPALPDHSQHHIWKRDFSGSSGLFAFTFKKDYPKEKIALFVNSLELFGIGYSWGGFKSLITAGKYERHEKSKYLNKTIIRLSIGLEDIDDIIKDLEKGFKTL